MDTIDKSQSTHPLTSLPPIAPTHDGADFPARNNAPSSIPAPLTIGLNPKRVFNYLAGCITLLVLLDSILCFIPLYTDSTYVATLSYIFDLDNEHNVPAIYSFVQLAVAGFLLLLIAVHASAQHDQLKNYWWLLAFLFFYLSIDELESLHERADSYIHRHFHSAGVPHFAWIIPAGIVVAIVGSLMLKFLASLPNRSRKQFLTAGIIFVAGAIGGDALIGDHMDTQVNGLDWIYMIEYHVEESLEMIGIAYFIYALLLYIRDTVSPEITFTISR